MISDVIVGLAFAVVIWLAIEPPSLPGWSESHRRVRRKRVRDEVE